MFSSPAFLKKLQSRNSEAITEVVQAYTKQLFRASLGLGFDANTSDELVQRVWATFFDVLPNFQAKSHVRTFLFGILYNKASEMRRENFRTDVADPVEEIMDRRFGEDGSWLIPPLDPERVAMAAESIHGIEDCLKGLSTAHRTAFWLKEVEELESAEICNALHINATNLRVVLFRARNGLRECLEAKALLESRKEK